ncbi:MAG: hypothetical protein K2W82_13700 [Candidatus Obscuribacterales bacterium]|nr:hypothetical protein [Candidatus Obscuribacterales bacterium]
MGLEREINSQNDSSSTNNEQPSFDAQKLLTDIDIVPQSLTVPVEFDYPLELTDKSAEEPRKNLLDQLQEHLNPQTKDKREKEFKQMIQRFKERTENEKEREESVRGLFPEIFGRAPEKYSPAQKKELQQATEKLLDP